MNNVKIVHKVLGKLLEEDFTDNIQFEIFLKTIDGCLVLKNDFDFFNGKSFLIHIPFDILRESFIFAKPQPNTLIDKILNKTLIEK